MKQETFKRVKVADLRQGRRGKHHEAVIRILKEIDALPDGEAMIIPVKDYGISMTNLRAALTKATASRGMKIATYSEGSKLYVWRKTAGTRAYERAAKGNAKRK